MILTVQSDIALKPPELIEIIVLISAFISFVEIVSFVSYAPTTGGVSYVLPALSSVRPAIAIPFSFR